MKRFLRPLTLLIFAAFQFAQPIALAESQLRFCLNAEPKTLNPLLVDDEASDTVRYLTGGVLLRLNRQTQQLEPALATAWKASADGRSIHFTLRPNLYFSDGTPFTAEDVAYTIEQLMDPKLHSPTGDAFRSSDGKVLAEITGKYEITIRFPAPVVGLEKLFDQVVMLSAKSPLHEKAVLGSYYLLGKQSRFLPSLATQPQLLEA